jgi:hypothetical protein
MPRDTIRSINPLSETEARTLQFLLDKAGQSQPAALEQRAKEREKERKAQAKLEAKVRAEEKLSRRLTELRLDIDRATAALYEKAESGVAFRHVATKLQEYGEKLPGFSFFNTQSDNVDYAQLLLLAELGLEMYQAGTKQKSSGRSLRERMQSVKIDVGPDGPGEGGAAPDNRAQLAQAIVRAGRRRRGEEQ